MIMQLPFHANYQQPFHANYNYNKSILPFYANYSYKNNNHFMQTTITETTTISCKLQLPLSNQQKKTLQLKQQISTNS